MRCARLAAARARANAGTRRMRCPSAAMRFRGRTAGVTQRVHATDVGGAAAWRLFHAAPAARMPRILDVDIYADIDRPQFLIDGYHGGVEAERKGGLARGGGFTVNGAPINGSILAHAKGVFLWDVTSVDALTVESLVAARVMDPRPEVILIGTGASAQLPKRDAWKAIKEWADAAQVGVEIMDSPSACSTFNILTQEERRVVAYLIAVEGLPRNDDGAIVPPMALRAAPVGRGGRRGVLVAEEMPDAEEPKRLPNMHPDTEWTKVG